jgi:hypothetical protein
MAEQTAKVEKRRKRSDFMVERILPLELVPAEAPCLAPGVSR